MQETQVQFLGREDPLEKEMAIHSTILTWKISWTEAPREVQSVGLQRAGHNLVTVHAHIFLLTNENKYGTPQNKKVINKSQDSHCVRNWKTFLKH